MLPNVKLNKLDNQLGTVPPQDGDTAAYCGNCTLGPLNTPGIYARSSDVIATFGEGPLVEEVCYEIEQTGRAVVVCRTDQTTAGAYGAITVTGPGTSVITADAVLKPVDDLECYVIFDTGGTIGVAGITYRYSLDDGRTMSAVQSLGTATNLTLPGSAKFLFAAGTILANQSFVCRTSAPLWNGAQLDAALVALQNTANDWDICRVVGPVVAADVATIETRATAMELLGKEKTFIVNTRLPNLAETEAQYKTAMDLAFSATVAMFTSICTAAADVQSPISQRRYRRPVGMVIAALAVNTKPGQDLAEVGLGPLPASVRITDDAGNPKHHDERIYPGLDDSRFTTLRTWAKRPGVFVNNARIFSAPGSDFQFLQHRRTMNVFCVVIRRVLERYSSADLLVNDQTGRILESEARDIDINVNAEAETELVDTRNATAAVFQLSRTDNILSTYKLRGDARLTPLAYPKFFEINVGFYNPALKTRSPEE